MTMLMFLAGLAALIAGAELLVRGASKLALSFGISPLVVHVQLIRQEGPIMLGASLLLLLLSLDGRIGFVDGAMLASLLVAYTVFLVAQQHDALGAFSSVMLGFVIPLTVITLVVVMLRRPAEQAG